MKELPITGYVDRFSHRPGECIRVHVSVREGGAYRSRLVRVLSADANPDGPGLRFEDLGGYWDQTSTGQRHPIHIGSCAEAPGPVLEGQGTHTWTALIFPALLSEQPRVVLSHESSDKHLTLSLTDRAVRVEVTTSSGEARCDLVGVVQAHRWYRVWASANEASETLLVGLQGIDALAGQATVRTMRVSQMGLPSGGRFIVAARNGKAWRDHFEGRIEDPALLDGAWERWADPRVTFGQLGSSVRAGWDFSLGIPTQEITDVGPKKLHGRLRNVPTRAVRGARWTGEDMRWSERPQEYAAIHFHSDDLSDCEWPVAFEFSIPKELRSGAYAFHLTCEGGEDWVPFYVLPSRQGPHSRIAFLVPTFTYQAYGNEAFGEHEEFFRARVRDWGAYPHNPYDFPIYGASTYNKHPDGSGIAFSSRLRPLISMRPAWISMPDRRGSGLRNYPADIQVLAWLESLGFAFDVVTDEDLHEEGESLLAPYAVVLTGSHPEYHTTRSLDAIQDYLRAGGRLIYTGGNGFYWRIGRNDALPHVMEVRRAEGGVRAWAAEPGEYYHAMDGAYGGLWRRNGRPPQALVGVGFSAQGPFESTYYRRTPQSYDARCAWIFEGVEGETFGDYGLSGGGAAGYELDRADPVLGTPTGAVVVARSENIPASFYVAMEEVLYFSITTGAPCTVSGEPAESFLRSDITYFETPAGGAVFSVGSITFCGSLWRKGFEGPVSRILENVVRKFSRLGAPHSSESL